MFCYPKKKWLILGARDFSCAVSGFGQVSKKDYSNPLVIYCGRNRSIRSHARKSSGTQDRSGLATTPVGSGSPLQCTRHVKKVKRKR